MRRLTSVSRGPMYETTSSHRALRPKLQLREPDSASQADRDMLQTNPARRAGTWLHSPSCSCVNLTVPARVTGT